MTRTFTWTTPGGAGYRAAGSRRAAKARRTYFE